MKLYDNKQISTIILSIFSGLLFAAYLLYDQNGTIGKTAIIALSLTTIIVIAITIIIIKKVNK
jgi:hypothetical protein